MEYRPLGSTGAAVSALCLGAMTCGKESDEKLSHAQLDRFVERGGNFIDTADVYSQGISEEIIGRWLAARPGVRGQIVLATKGRFPLRGGPNDHGLSRTHLTPALEASLRRPGVASYAPRNAMERTWRTVDAVRGAAEDRGVSMAQVALAWVADRPAVTSVILGARPLEQPDDTLGAAGLHLSERETALLDEASAPAAADHPYGGPGAPPRA